MQKKSSPKIIYMNNYQKIIHNQNNYITLLTYHTSNRCKIFGFSFLYMTIFVYDSFPVNSYGFAVQCFLIKISFFFADIFLITQQPKLQDSFGLKIALYILFLPNTYCYLIFDLKLPAVNWPLYQGI